uniref:Uncharacterized protein n=1 Tax=Romanomermis culicivorax TaxID=13658 RepID=A0A915IBQ8_ROMCU
MVAIPGESPAGLDISMDIMAKMYRIYLKNCQEPAAVNFVINYSCDYSSYDISNLQDISSADQCIAQCNQKLRRKRSVLIRC